MNRRVISLAAVVGLTISSLLLTSCNREPLDESMVQEEAISDDEVIKAVFPIVQFVGEDGTRTTYSDDPTDNFAWEAGDQIEVFYNIGERGTGTYDNITATLHPISGSAHIATITGLTASHIHSGYPCVAFFGDDIMDKSVTETYVECACRPSFYTSRQRQEIYIDISGDIKSNHVNMGMVSVYNHSTETFNFSHQSFGLLRFICNNVPSGTSFINVAAGSSSWTYYSDPILSSTWIATRYYYSGDNAGTLDTGFPSADTAAISNAVDFYLVADIDSGGLSTNDSGIILNLPVATDMSTSYSYGNFTLTAYSSSGSNLGQKTISSTATVNPGDGYRYTVNFD